MKSHHILAVVFFAVLGACAEDAPSWDMTAYVSQEYGQTIDDYYSATEEGRVAIGFFLVGGATDYEGTFIFSNDLYVADADTVFQIGSITKTFTSALLAQKVALGDMAWTDPAQAHLPPATGAIPGPVLPTTFGDDDSAVTITLEQLLSHHTGFRQNLDVLEAADGDTTPYLYAFDEIDDEALLFASGDDCYQYSNVAFGVAGLTVSWMENPLQVDYYDEYETVLVEKLVGPLGMDDTRITLDNDQQLRLATPYDEDGNEADYELSRWPMNHAGGALYSTLPNMLIYAREMTGDAVVLSDAEVDDLFTDRNKIWNSLCDDDTGYSAWQGLGWFKKEDLDDPLTGDAITRYSKDGLTDGFSSYISVSTPTIDGIDYRAGVVIITNKRGYPVNTAPDVLQEMFDQEFAPLHPPSTASTTGLAW